MAARSARTIASAACALPARDRSVCRIIAAERLAKEVDSTGAASWSDSKPPGMGSGAS